MSFEHWKMQLLIDAIRHGKNREVLMIGDYFLEILFEQGAPYKFLPFLEFLESDSGSARSRVA